jgi:hypothetical protein
MKIRTKSYIEKLLPEPQPNSEPLLMGIASAPILQNPLLYVRPSTQSAEFCSFSNEEEFVSRSVRTSQALL